MIKTIIYASILLTVIWIILCEVFTVTTVLTGICISVVSMYFFLHFFRVSRTIAINFFRLAVYAFYLIAQIFLSGFSAIKMIILGADVDIVKVKTKITDSYLRTLLANSITLTPGTVSLELSGDEITVLRLVKAAEQSQNTDDTDEQTKGKLERMLLKAQK